MKVRAYFPRDTAAIVPEMRDGEMIYHVTLVCVALTANDMKTLINCIDDSSMGALDLEIKEQGQ